MVYLSSCLWLAFRIQRTVAVEQPLDRERLEQLHGTAHEVGECVDQSDLRHMGSRSRASPSMRPSSLGSRWFWTDRGSGGGILSTSGGLVPSRVRFQLRRIPDPTRENKTRVPLLTDG